MTRIVWVHARRVLGEHGGSELRTRTLLSSVLKAGHSVLLIQQHARRQHTHLPGLEVVSLALCEGALRYVANLRSGRPLSARTMAHSTLPEVRAQIDAFQPDVCVLSELAGFEIAEQLVPASCPWLYDAHNVEPELFADLAAAERNPARKVAFAIDAGRSAEVQRRVLDRCSAIVAVSSRDRTKLLAVRPGLHCEVVPSSVPNQSIQRPAAAGPTVLFVGTLSYYPNVQAVDALLCDIMPTVRELIPDARLLVVGRNPSRRMVRELRKRPWCGVVKDVGDLTPYYTQARCVAIPLRTGSGSRLKTYEAMSYGIPVVGSPLAFDGIPIQDGVTGFLAHSTDGFVRLVSRLLGDAGLAGNAGQSSWEYFNNNLAPDAASAPLIDLIGGVRGDQVIGAAR